VKNENQVIVQAVMAAPPSVRNMDQNDRDRKGPSLQLLFPLSWTHNGVAHVIVASAISTTARSIQEHIQPGEPLLVTGSFDRRQEGVRLRLTSIQRSVTRKATRSVPGVGGTLLALEDGRCTFTMNCHSFKDSVAAGEFYRSTVNYTDAGGRSHYFEVRSEVPLRGGQAVAMSGHFERPATLPESEGQIIADLTDIGERITSPANLSIRDPRDRLQFDAVNGMDALDRVGVADSPQGKAERHSI